MYEFAPHLYAVSISLFWSEEVKTITGIVLYTSCDFNSAKTSRPLYFVFHNLFHGFQQIDSHTEVDKKLLLGKIFDDVGFNVIDDKVFGQLIQSGLTYPVSKLKTSDYLEK